MKLLDLFSGRWGWSKAFAERGWECVGIDLTEPPEIPPGCTFIKADVTQLVSMGNGRFSIFENDAGNGTGEELWTFKPDFICASSPCEQFSVHGMKHFHPNPPYPELGLKLFNHTRAILEKSGLPYIMENVRAAQKFVGNAVNHCGSFYLWGTGVPTLIPKGLSKGFGDMSTAHYHRNLVRISPHIRARNTATIPVELATTVADYAERIREPRRTA